MTALDMVKLIVGAGSLFVALLVLAAALVYVGMTWSVRRRDVVAETLAAAGIDARSGCTCEGCEQLRTAVVDVMFQVTDKDIAELNRIGITWGSS